MILLKRNWILKINIKFIKKEYESKFNDYRDQIEKEKYINEYISKHTIHQFIKQIKVNEHLWDFGAVSFHPISMWDEKSIIPRSETVYAYTRFLIDQLVKKIICCNCYQGSAIL